MDNYLIDTANLRLTELELLTRLLVAIGIGFLIGLEREHSAMAKKEHIFAGVRTFVFLSLLGFTGGLMYHIFSPVVFAAVLLAVITLTCISYWITANKGDIGGTSELTDRKSVV